MEITMTDKSKVEVRFVAPVDESRFISRTRGQTPVDGRVTLFLGEKRLEWLGRRAQEARVSRVHYIQSLIDAQMDVNP